MEPIIDILSCKNEDITLRDNQIEALRWLQDNWNNYDVFVLNKPVASGKSIVVTSLDNWLDKNRLGTTANVTPTKMLQDQYAKDFDWIPLLKGMDNYQCASQPVATCATFKRFAGNCCGGGLCGYLKARARALAAQTCMLNFHVYVANELYKTNLIIDEAHNATNFLFGMYEKNFWKCEWNYPDDMPVTGPGLTEWLGKVLIVLNEQLHIAISTKNNDLAKENEEETARIGRMIGALAQFGNDILIVRKTMKYSGKLKRFRDSDQEVITVKPLRVANLAADMLWPDDQVKKIVMLSSTIGATDVEELGLKDRRVGYFESGSPIAPERRPFMVWPVASMTYRNRQESMPTIVKAITNLAKRYAGKKGLIHTTYATARELRKELGNDPRFLFHTKIDKDDQYQRFRASKSDHILVASGMSEGIDLAYDAAGWQVIVEVPRPSLEDDVNNWRLHNAKHLYDSDTIRTILQRYGRVCRAPDDTGVTIMLDSEFIPLYKRTYAKYGAAMWPKWFTSAIQWPKPK